MRSYCPEIKCMYYDVNGCKAEEIYHSTDLFCVSYKRKDNDDYTNMMRASEPKGHKRGGKWVSN